MADITSRSSAEQIGSLFDGMSLVELEKVSDNLRTKIFQRKVNGKRKLSKNSI
jgi:hypothetical protein